MSDVETILQALRDASSPKIRADMAPRYGIVVDKAFGVAMKDMLAIAKPSRGDHDLAEALWRTGWYEARIVATLLDDPAQVTRAQMDRWRSDFDNWAIVDSACFKLFDKVPFAAEVVEPWSRLNDEFGRRAAFALLACLALHGRGAREDFIAGLSLIEAAATDGRNFVKKGVSWALRSIGGKRDPTLREQARDLASRLAASPDKNARWIGSDACRAFKKADASPPAKKRKPSRSSN